MAVIATTTNPVLSRTGRTDEAAEVRRLVNAERNRRGLGDLTYNKRLTRSAHYRAADMARRDYFSHHGWVAAIRRFGYLKLSRTAGENIAKGQTSAREVYTDWMNSRLHRDNILAGKYREMGVARVDDVWVQCFGRRR